MGLRRARRAAAQGLTDPPLHPAPPHAAHDAALKLKGEMYMEVTMKTIELSVRAQKIFDTAFMAPRDPRSEEYKNGVRAILAFRIDGVQIPHLYEPATAADDAYYAGQAEGHHIWRNNG